MLFLLLVFQSSRFFINCCDTISPLRCHVLYDITGEHLKSFSFDESYCIWVKFRFSRPATLWVNLVSSSNSLSDNLAAKFILEQLFIKTCITSASGINLVISTSFPDCTQAEVADNGSWRDVVVDPGAWCDAVVDAGPWINTAVDTGVWSDVVIDTGTQSDTVVDTGAWSDAVVDTGAWNDAVVDTEAWSDVITILVGEYVKIDDIGISSAEVL